MAGTATNPEFSNSSTQSVSASSNSNVANLPVTLATNGIFIACVISKNNETHATATPGWTKLNQVNAGASFTASIWIALQSAAAPTFTWTTAVANAAQITYYEDPNGQLTNAVSVSGTPGANTGTTTHTSTGFTSDADNALAVYIDACSTNATGLAVPVGWTEDTDVGSATSVTRFTWGHKNLGASGSSSGNISVTGGGTAHVQFQVQLKNVPTAGHSTTKAELDVWAEPQGTSFSKAELLAWADADDCRFAKMDMLVWVDLPSSGRRRQLINC